MADELKGSETRLWQLIAERCQAGVDTKRIDQRIWDLFGEEWAVMFTDLSGFSRQVAAFGIIHFLQVIYEQKRLLLPAVAEHDGILIKVEADSFLIIFKRPAAAISCAVAMQRISQNYNQRRPPEEQVLLCVGVGFGKILRIGDHDVFGEEVNAASKLGEDTAKANEILVTERAKQAATEIDDLTWEPIDVSLPGGVRAFRALYETAS